jgi:tetratricopeptide (TPR) repeat protein
MLLAGALAIVSTACASSGAGGGGGGTAPAAGGARPQAQGPQLAQGEAEVENGNTREAERQIGIAMIQQGEAQRAAYQAAAAAAERGIAADPRNPLPLKQAGQAYLGLKQYEKADSAFKKAEALRPIAKLEIDPMREQAWIDLYREGAELLNQGVSRYAEVAPIYERANLIYNQRPEIMALLGQVYLELNQTDKAIENLKGALAIIQSPKINEMDSVSAENWRATGEEIPPVLAQAYIKAQRFPEAVGLIRPMLAADPSNADYARTLASIFATMGQQDSVRAVYQQMERSAGASLTAYDYQVIGLGYYELKDYQAAANSLQTALQKAPKDRDAAEWRARSLFYHVQDLGANPDKALVQQLVDAARLWLQLDPNSGDAHTMLLQGLNLLNGQADPEIQRVYQAAEAMKIEVTNLQMRRERGGGATVVGDVVNKSATAGANVTVHMLFFNASGAQVGTQDVQIRLGAANAPVPLDVKFESTTPVEGYSYTVAIP